MYQEKPSRPAAPYTLFEIFIFCPKIQLWSPLKIVDFLGEKLVKMLWFWTFKLLTTLISREKLSKKNLVKNSWKCWGFVKIDKNLTFRIVWILVFLMIWIWSSHFSLSNILMSLTTSTLVWWWLFLRTHVSSTIFHPLRPPLSQIHFLKVHNFSSEITSTEFIFNSIFSHNIELIFRFIIFVAQIQFLLETILNLWVSGLYPNPLGCVGGN